MKMAIYLKLAPPVSWLRYFNMKSIISPANFFWIMPRIYMKFRQIISQIIPAGEKLSKMTTKPKIVFFGTSDRAVIVLEVLKQANLSPIFVVTQPDRSAGRKLVKTAPPVKIWAGKEKIPVFQPENLENQMFLETLEKGNFDVFVVVAYGKILKQKILDIPKYGVLNF